MGVVIFNFILFCLFYPIKYFIWKKSERHCQQDIYATASIIFFEGVSDQP